MAFRAQASLSALLHVFNQFEIAASPHFRFLTGPTQASVKVRSTHVCVTTFQGDLACLFLKSSVSKHSKISLTLQSESFQPLVRFDPCRLHAHLNDVLSPYPHFV